MEYVDRQIIAWLAILLGAYFLARSGVSKREKGAMKELLGLRIDKVKFFRNFFIQRLENLIGFFFVLVGVGIHLYVLIRSAQAQATTPQNDPQEALRAALSYLGVAVLAMVVITAVMHWICSYFSRRIFLDILGYLMVRYDYRLEDDPDLLKQIGDILGVEHAEDDTVLSYTRRIEEGLKLTAIESRLRERGKLPARQTFDEADDEL